MVEDARLPRLPSAWVAQGSGLHTPWVYCFHILVPLEPNPPSLGLRDPTSSYSMDKKPEDCWWKGQGIAELW